MARVLGTAAVAHVHADHVHPRCPGFAAGPDDVAASRSSLPTRARSPRSLRSSLWLPVAVAKHLDAVFNIKETLFGRRNRFRRGRKFPAMVCAWPLRNGRRGRNGSPKWSRTKVGLPWIRPSNRQLAHGLIVGCDGTPLLYLIIDVFTARLVASRPSPMRSELEFPHADLRISLRVMWTQI